MFFAVLSSVMKFINEINLAILGDLRHWIPKCVELFARPEAIDKSGRVIIWYQLESKVGNC